MSIEAVAQVLKHSKATGRAKLVLIGIANHMGDQGSWPSISTLAAYANASERSVKRDIQELVELGELVVELQNAPVNNQYKTNLYWITLDEPGVTTQVVRGDNSGKSGVTTGGTLTINRTIKESNNRATRIPDSFEVTDEMRVWAAREVPDVDLDRETANFIDYWQAKPTNATKLDWVRTWRTWMRNVRPSPKRPIRDRQAENAKALEEFLRMQEAQND